MGQFKPWQIAVLAIALIGVAVMTFYSCSGGDSRVNLADELKLVDVQTGTVYVVKLDQKRPVSIPAKSPTSGARSLFPIYEKEGGWFISGHMLAGVKQVQGVKEGLVADGRSGKLTLTDPTATPLDPYAKQP
jgi:hypothetical protein